jgi:hypothetical protein
MGLRWREDPRESRYRLTQKNADQREKEQQSHRLERCDRCAVYGNKCQAAPLWTLDEQQRTTDLTGEFTSTGQLRSQLLEVSGARSLRRAADDGERRFVHHVQSTILVSE